MFPDFFYIKECLMPAEQKLKSGFVALVGKPNAGKSTLVNAMTGAKVAITSPRPQTTRNKIMGIRNGRGHQIIFVDTPGVKETRNELDYFMEKIYKEESKHSDIILFIADGSVPCSQEDINVKEMLGTLFSSDIPIWLVINKADRCKQEDYGKEYTFLADFDKVFTVSAVHGDGLEALINEIATHLPEGPLYFPADMDTDQSPLLFAAEIVRENILTLIQDEVPHGIFVHTEEMRPGKKAGSLYFKINIYVERNSHKGIIIGKDGKMLKKIGMRSRQELEANMNKEVFVDLWVKVKEKWKERKDLLKSWGYA